jgi:hypothetical protein
MLALKIESDDVLGFIKDVLTFTDDEIDTATNTELQTAYEHYLREDRNAYLTDRDKSKINKISQYIREKARIPGNGIEWKLCPEKGKEQKITRNGKQVKGFKGVKINPDYLVIKEDF